MKSILALLAALLFSSAAAHAEISGTVSALQDGDTFDLCDRGICHRIRICGIDAPENGTIKADAATEMLQALVQGNAVICVQVGHGTICDGRSEPKNQGRIVAQCLADGQDIGGAMVKSDVACEWVKFSGGAYGGTPCPDRKD